MIQQPSGCDSPAAPHTRSAPSPHRGEGWGEGVRSLSIDLNPSPHPSPSRSRIYPTSADLRCRTRVNPSSVGEGADRISRSGGGLLGPFDNDDASGYGPAKTGHRAVTEA